MSKILGASSEKRKGIETSFSRLFISSMLIISVIFIAAIIGFFTVEEATAKENLQDKAEIAANNLDRYFNQVERAGYGISSNWSVINLYSASKQLTDINASTNAYQMVSLLVSLEYNITDVLIVTPQGDSRSFFAGIDYSAFTNLDIASIVSDESDFSRSFYFFPKGHEFADKYFLYCVPVVSFTVNPDNAKKEATALILLNKATIMDMIYSGNERIHNESFALVYNGEVVFSSEEGLNEDIVKNYISSVEMDKYGTTVLANKEIDYFGGEYNFILPTIIALFLCMGLMIFVYFWLLKTKITKPIKTTKNQLVSYNAKNLSEQIMNTGVFEIDDIIRDINHMILQIKKATKDRIITHNKLLEVQLRETEAELYALQSQINPHFLYNTLQCISGLAVMGYASSVNQVVLAMTDIIKYSMDPVKIVYCSDEIDIILNYISIYKIRQNGNIETCIKIDDEIHENKMLKMIVQPTVENIMEHAHVGNGDKLIISLTAKTQDDKMIFVVKDNGMGIEPERLKALKENLETDFDDFIKGKSSFGFGLYNINRRIKLFYGEEYGINIDSGSSGTEIEIVIPNINK